MTSVFTTIPEHSQQIKTGQQNGDWISIREMAVKIELHALHRIQTPVKVAASMREVERGSTPPSAGRKRRLSVWPQLVPIIFCLSEEFCL
jgi:hypothetical protein